MIFLLICHSEAQRYLKIERAADVAVHLNEHCVAHLPVLTVRRVAILGELVEVSALLVGRQPLFLHLGTSEEEKGASHVVFYDFQFIMFYFFLFVILLDPIEMHFLEMLLDLLASLYLIFVVTIVLSTVSDVMERLKKRAKHFQFG